MKSLFSVFLGCAGAVWAQSPQVMQEKTSWQTVSTRGVLYYCFAVIS